MGSGEAYEGRCPSCHIISHHITSHHIISYHIISYHIISYHTIYPILSYHITSHHIISSHISYHISYPVLSRHITSHHIIHIITWRTSCQHGSDFFFCCKVQWNTKLLSVHSQNFGRCVHLCNPNPYQNREHYYHPRKVPHALPRPCPSPPRGNHCSVFVPTVFQFCLF